MKKTQTLLIASLSLIVFTSGQVSKAQSVTIPISEPVSGKYLFIGNLPGTVTQNGNNQLFLVDTFSGNVNLIVTNELFLDSPIWNSEGTQIAFLNGRTTSVYNTSTASQTDIPNLGLLSYPQSWSFDTTRLLYLRHSPDTIPATDELQILDLSSGNSTLLFSFQFHEILNSIPLPPLPNGVTQLSLSEMRKAEWNPVYTDWIAIQMIGYTSEVSINELSEGATFPVTFLYNLQTGQMLSLDVLFTSSRIAFDAITWSPDGRYLAIQTSEIGDNATHIVAFNQSSQGAVLTVLDSAVSGNQGLLGWLGAGYLLHTIGRDAVTNDTIHYIGQIVDGNWYSTEFFRLPRSTFERNGGGGDWYITASESEEQTLTCLFDQTLPSRLSVGTHGRVAFTNGTSSHLRSEPTTYSTVVTEMSEGTEFDVIGGTSCANGYRWWQLQLANGTRGWAAEADTQMYFLEP